jgi:hypothetical protein
MGLVCMYIFKDIDRVNSIDIVNIIIIIIDAMLVDWLGVRDTKYENITSIPLT